MSTLCSSKGWWSWAPCCGCSTTPARAALPPRYETIAIKAGVARSTVAIKALEFAGALTWQNRIARIRERCTDLFGKDSWRWRVIRTSNAYRFTDPNGANLAGIPSKSDQRTGSAEPARAAQAIAAKDGIEEAAG